MYRKFFLIGLLALVMSCDKDNNDVTGEKSPTQLLTQKNWVLASYGYDSNGNNIIDPSEESIEDCQKDNLYDFDADGKGSFDDRELICGNGNTKIFFDWKWIVEGELLSIGFQYVNILRLNENEMMFYVELGSVGQSVRYISRYGH